MSDNAWDGHFRDEIQCPHCNALDHEFTDYPDALQHDGDRVVTECGFCGKPMKVTICVEYTYATEPLPPAAMGTCDGASEPHEMEPGVCKRWQPAPRDPSEGEKT